MSRATLVVMVALLSIMKLAVASSDCPVSYCDVNDPRSEQHTLYAGSMGLMIYGQYLTMYARKPDGTFHQEEYSRLRLNQVAEARLGVTGECDMVRGSIYNLTSMDRLIQSVDFTTACCEVTRIIDTIGPGIPREALIMNVTYPDHPGFHMTITISTVNETYTIHREGSPETNGPYDISYEAGKVKYDLDMFDWPWMANDAASNSSEPSYLILYFYVIGEMAPPSKVNVTDLPRYLRYMGESSSSRMKIDFLTIFTTDGVDHYSEVNKVGGDGYSWQNTSFAFNAPFAVCQGNRTLPRYSHLNYDPSLEALFLSPPADPTQPITPGAAAKRKLSPAAYAVPIAIVAVALIAAAIYIFFIRIPESRRGTKLTTQ